MPRHRTTIPWTPETTRAAVRLQAQGLDLRAIGERLGGFSESTVRWRLKASDDPDAVAARREADRARGRKGRPPAALAQRVPPQVEAERAARLSAPRSLTAIVFGDPPPGFSALDRRGKGHDRWGSR